MAREWKLRSTLPQTEEEYFMNARQAENYRVIEQTAASQIQSCWRSHAVRKRLKVVGSAALAIQSCFRGYRGRARAFGHAWKNATAARQTYFSVAATEIQRRWRGYYYRNFVHSLRSRERYLAAVAGADENLRDQLRALHEKQVNEQLTQEEFDMRRKFNNTIAGLHHLVSTEVCPGIYNSPFSAVTGGPPSIGGTVLEDHLRSTRQGRDLLPVVNASAEMWPNSRIDQVETPCLGGGMTGGAYNKVDSKHWKAEQKPFLAGGKLAPSPLPASVRANSPFGRHEQQEKLQARRNQGKIRPFYSTTKTIEVFDHM